MQSRIVSHALAFGFFLSASPGNARPMDDHARAHYLLLFLRYVTWPLTAFPAGDSPLVIGVVDGDPFGALLDSTVARAGSQGRRIRVRRLLRAEDAEGIHIAFISRHSPYPHGYWLDPFRNRPILTVVEDERSFASGAIILLTPVDGHLRFDVNLPVLRDSGLRIDSPMLVSARRLVRNVRSG